MAFDPSTEILTAPFTKIAANGQGDLQCALGRTSCYSEIQLVADVNAAGQDVGKINMWAKYKPFRDNTVVFDRYTDTNSARKAALIAANYGLSWDYTAQQSIQSAFGRVWTYLKPRVGREPLRALDLDGYYAGAQAPVTPVGDITLNRALYSHYDFSNSIYIQRNTYSVGWDDIPALSNYYFCAAFAKQADFSTASPILYKTSAETFSEGNPPTLDLSASDLDTIRQNGYTHYFLCAASAPHTSFGDAIPSSTFLPLPCQNASDLTGAFTVTSGGIDAGMTLKWAYFRANPTSASAFVDISEYWSERTGEYYNVGTNYYLHLGIVVTTDSTPVTLTRSNLTMQIIDNFADGTVDGILFSGMRDENWNSVDSISIPANTTKTVYLLTSGTTLNINSQGQAVVVQTGQEKSVTIRLKQNGVSIEAFMICIKNNP